MPDDLLPPADAAKYLGICERLLKYHVDAGELLAINVGRGVKKRRLKYDPADLDAFKAKRKTSGRPCQSGNEKTEFTNSISRSNVIDLMDRLASGQSAPPRHTRPERASKQKRTSKS